MFACPPCFLKRPCELKHLPASQTLPVTARHANGELEYNMHNLYGHTMATTTHAALQSVNGKRPFILTR